MTRSPAARLLTLAALAVAGWLLCPLPAATQTVTGTAVAEENLRPLQAALVALLDSAGHRRVNVLTDSAGRFLLRAPAPGRYRVLLSHIGRRDVVSGEASLRAGATVDVRLEVAIAPLLLKPIVVDARSRCKVRPEAGELASDLWEEARKAMDVSALTRSSFRGLVRMHRRVLEPGSLAVLRDSTWQHSSWATRAFGSQTEEELDRLGYVRQDGADWLYAGPDEQVLRSDGFMDHHCLRPVKGDAQHSGMVGVAFQPVQDKRPDIEGVVWLDARSAELRTVDFHYTGLPWSVPLESQGGRIVFGRTASGALAVTTWSLRMPQIAIRRGYTAPGRSAFAGEIVTVLRVFETGGEAVEETAVRAAPPPPP